MAKNQSPWTYRVVLFVVLVWTCGPGMARAGVFDLPGFLEPGQWSVGMEPEIVLSNGTGAAINLKPRYGHNNFLNWEGILGTGSGAREFRVGLIADFEWFPDYANQPGIATPVSATYYRFEEDNLVELGIKPMIYKTFPGDQAEFTPFIAFPLGWNFLDSNVTGFAQIALGSMIQIPDMDRWRFTLEVGFNANDSFSYLSGGLTFYP